MSEEPEQHKPSRKRPGHWYVGGSALVLVLLLVAYPLSLGPVAERYMFLDIPAGGGYKARVTPLLYSYSYRISQPSVLEIAYAPLMWLCDQSTIVDSAMRQYLMRYGRTYQIEPSTRGSTAPKRLPRTWLPPS